MIRENFIVASEHRSPKSTTLPGEFQYFNKPARLVRTPEYRFSRANVYLTKRQHRKSGFDFIKINEAVQLVTKQFCPHVRGDNPRALARGGGQT